MRRLLHLLLPAALLVLALLVVAGCGASPGGGARQAEQPTGETEAGASGSDEGTGGATEELGDPTLGAADAPVVMVEWGDFQ